MAQSDVDDQIDRRAIHEGETITEEMADAQTLIDGYADTLATATFENDLTDPAALDAIAAMSNQMHEYSQLANRYYQNDFDELVGDDLDGILTAVVDPFPDGLSVLILADPGNQGDTEDVIYGSAPDPFPTERTVSFAEINLDFDQRKTKNFTLPATVFASDNADNRALLVENWIRLVSAFADYRDRYVAGILDGAIPGGNKIGSVVTPKVPTKADMYDYILQLDNLLDAAAVPVKNRWCVIPDWALRYLRQDTARFPTFGNIAPFSDSQRLRGHLGWIGKLEIIQSERVPNTTGAKYKFLAGQSDPIHSETRLPAGITLAEQFADFQIFNATGLYPADTGVAAKGVVGAHIYGGRVVNANGFAVLIANNTP